MTDATSTTIQPADPKHVVVIGAGPGIGAGVARRFGAVGFRVTLVARRPEALERLASEIRAGGVTVDIVAADAADPDAFGDALASVFGGSGAPGVLVYNVGLLEQDDLLTSSAERLSTAYSVNVVSAIVAVQAALPSLRAVGSGTILFTGGGLADHPQPTLATLSLGKLALRAAAELLAKDLAGDGIHVASITVNGSVKPGTPFDPDLIADAYWSLHAEAQPDWTTEIKFDGGA